MTPPLGLACSGTNTVLAVKTINKDDNITDDNKNKIAEENIERTFKDLFESYGKTFSYDILCKILGEGYSKDKILKFQTFELNDAIEKVKIKFDTKTYDINLPDNICSIALQTGWNIEEFAEANKNYKPIDTNNIKNEIIKLYAKDNNGKAVDFKDIPKEYISKQFGLILANTTDDEKASLLRFVINDLKDNKLLELLFSSFKNKDKLLQCADSISFEEFQNIIDNDVRNTLVKNMSYARTGKLLSELNEDARIYYMKNKEVLDRVFLLDDSQITNENELKIKHEFMEKMHIVSETQIAIGDNENLDDEQKEELTEQTFGIFKGTPFENIYIEQLANTLSNRKLSDQIKELFDKYTDGKFSEKYDKIPEKSAIDQENGGFKKVGEEVVNTSKEKIKVITEEIELNTPQVDSLPQVEHNNKESELVIIKDDSDNTYIANAGKTSYFENFGSGFKAVKGFLNGKTDGFESGSDKHEAIEKYSNMDFNEQLLILKSSLLGKYFRVCIENAKFVTLKKLHDLNLVASDSYNTKFAEQMYEEQKDKRNMAS